ncbi:MAG: transposase [Ruminococcus sp.]|nr:transposase [Ruminococcus sp.]
MNNHNDIKELTMMLLYLTRFDRKSGDVIEKDLSWKGYPFEILDELNDDGLILDNNTRRKTVALTDGGIDYAESLLKKYGINGQ